MKKLNPEVKKVLTDLSKGKPVALFGRGKSAMSAQKLLSVYGIESVFYEEKNSKDSSGKSETFKKSSLKKHALAVYSPAFRPDHTWIKSAQDVGIETLCEPDLAALAWKGKTIVVTGTDGKTTTTNFTAKVLKDNDIPVVTAGNIGTPLSEYCADFAKKGITTENITAVCELSSFQTFKLKYLTCDALVWTNFAPDHMDWHTSMEEYFTAKRNILNRLKSKIFITDKSSALAALKYSAPFPDFAQILDFETSEAKQEALNIPKPFDTSIQSKNYAMVRELCKKMFGITELALRSSAIDFSLPKYRFGNWTSVNKVKFYNDSKATNAHSAIAALKELDGYPNLIWIGGGKDKFCDLTELCNQVRTCALGAVLIGQTAPKLSSMLSGLPFGAKICSNLEEAVEIAYGMCPKAEGTVLFSPAFSSFGMFNGYAERGKSFENAVLCLKNLKEC